MSLREIQMVSQNLRENRSPDSDEAAANSIESDMKRAVVKSTDLGSKAGLRSEPNSRPVKRKEKSIRKRLHIRGRH